MTLGDYLLATGQTRQAFADQVGRAQPTVSKYVRGDLIPDRETMLEIYRITGGQVTPNDFYPLELKRAS